MQGSIEYKGNVYEIGKEYLCHKSGTSRPPHLDELVRINFDNEVFPFETTSGIWGEILAIDPNTLGTITKAKVKPKDGEWWLCEFDGDNRVMLFSGGYWTHDESRKGPRFEMVKPIHKMGVIDSNDY